VPLGDLDPLWVEFAALDRPESPSQFAESQGRRLPHRDQDVPLRPTPCSARGRTPTIKRTATRPAPPGVMSPREIIPTVRYDAQTVNAAAGPLERFATLSCEILLLGGSRSASNLTASLDGLCRVLPGARRVVMRGSGHTAGTPPQTTAVIRIE
jgi:hypothetical protein